MTTTRIVSAVLDLTTDPKDEDIISFAFVGEIEGAAGSILPCPRLAGGHREEDYQPHYLTWKGRVLKRTILFLCVGDN